MALRMPDLAANANALSNLSPNPPAVGKSTGSIFLDLLSQATGNSLPPATDSDGGTLSQAKTSSKSTRQAFSGSAMSSRAGTSHSLLHTRIQPSPATATETASPQVTKLNALALSVPPSPTTSSSEEARSDEPSLLSPLSTVGLSKSEISSTPDLFAPQFTSIAAEGSVANAPESCADGTSPRRNFGVVNSTEIPAHNSGVVPASATSRLAPSRPAKSEEPIDSASSSPESTQPQVSALNSDDLDSLTTRLENTVDSTLDLPAHGTATPLIHSSAPLGDVTTASYSIEPASDVSILENVPGTPEPLDPVMSHSPQTSYPAQSQRQTARTTDTTQKSTTDFSFTHRLDRTPAILPQTHTERIQQTTLSDDRMSVPQIAPSTKDSAKPEVNQPATNSQAANSDRVSSASNSDRNSPPTSGNGSTHDAKREEAAPAQSRDIPVAAVQDLTGAQGSSAREGFANLITSQLSAANAAKGESPAAHIPIPNGSADSSSGGATVDVDRAEQSALAGTVPGMIHSAKLVSQAAQSELHVGFQAGEFGNVDIRTSMVRSQVTAEISVEHSELRNLLAVELPHLQTKLAEHPITSANVVLSNHTGGGSSSPRHSYQQNANGSGDSNSRQSESDALLGPAALTEAQVSTSQLDVHM